MTDNTAPIDMDTIRHNCITRISFLVQALEALRTVDGALDNAADHIHSAMDDYKYPPLKTNGIEAVGYFAEQESEHIKEVMRNSAGQYARLLARDVIAPVARTSGDKAVVFITGNSMMPPLREIESCDVIWDAQEYDQDIWPLFAEQLESTLEEHHVFMGQPDYDNSLYVVDLRRFEHNEAEGADFFSDEWVAIKQDD